MLNRPADTSATAYDRLRATLLKVGQQDLFGRGALYDKDLFNKGFGLFRDGKFGLVSSTLQKNQLKLVFRVNDTDQVVVHPHPGSARALLDEATCSCTEWQKNEECSHVACADLIIWGLAQISARQAKYGLTPTNRKKLVAIQEFLQSDYTSSNSDTNEPTDLGHSIEIPRITVNENVESAVAVHLQYALICLKQTSDMKFEAATDSIKFPALASPPPGPYPNLFRRNFSTASQWNRGLDPFLEWPIEIQYVFSDSTCLDLKEIGHHRYRDLISPRLLPAFDRPEFFSSYALTTKESFPKKFEHEITVLRAIDLLFREKEKLSLKICFSLSNTRSVDREAFELNELAFVPSDPVKRTALRGLDFAYGLSGSAPVEDRFGAKLKFEFMNGPTDRIVGYNFLVDMSERRLLFHPFAKEIDFFLSHRSLGLLENPFAGSWNESFIIGDNAINKTASYVLEAHDHGRGYPKGKLTGNQVIIADEDLSVHINLQSQSQFSVAIGFANETILSEGLPTFFTDLIEGFRVGLAGWSLMSELLASHVGKRMFRPADSRVIYHCGIFALLIRRTFDAHSTQSFHESFHNQLIEEIENIIFASESDAPKSVGKLSKPLNEQIQKFCQWLVTSIEKTHYLTASDTLYVMPTLHKRIALLFYKWIDYTERIVGKQVYVGARNANLQSWGFNAPQDIIEMRPSNASAPATQFQFSVRSERGFWNLRSWITLCQECGYKLTYRSQEVTAIDVNNFKAEFNVTDTSENKNTTSSTSQTVKETNEESSSVEIKSQSLNIDWFELNPRFFLSGIELTQNQADTLFEQGFIDFQGRIFVIDESKLPSIRGLENFWNSLTQTRNESGEKIPGNSRFFHLGRHHVLDLLALRSQGAIVGGSAKWQKVCEFYDSLSRPRSPQTPSEKFRGTLKAYQEIGTNWLLDLYQLRIGGILADDMGLGKTIQALAFIDILHSKNELGKILIVVPATLVFNWISEFEKFVPHIQVQELSSVTANEFKKESGVSYQKAFICTYNYLSDARELLTEVKWNIVIFDEAQNLKTLTSQRTQAARSLEANFKTCLTGTPLENHLGEAFSLVDLSIPGALGTYPTFRKEFLNPNQAVPMDKIRHLKLKLRPLLLRRTKKEILKELPEKTEIVLPVPFDTEQKEIYRNIALSWNDRVRESVQSMGEAKSQLIMITALLRLRQVCSDPAGLPGVNYSTTPPKVNLLVESLEEILDSGESAVVFTQFLATFDRVRNALKDAGLNFYELNGNMPKKKKDESIQGFAQDVSPSVLVATLKTGGVGLNLTKASYVFHLEPWWNPAVENQATDRTHRIGQTRSVTVYRYIMKDSIEEKIEILKSHKLKQFESLLGVDDESTLQLAGKEILTQEDFRYLIGEVENY